jgi:hypothetical protein
MVLDWWYKLQKQPLGSKDEANKISTKSLILSGFAFTALTFAFGFFPKPLSVQVVVVVFSLLLSSVLFLVACELADYAFYFGELAVAEILYFGAALLLFSSMTYFAYFELSSIIALIPVIPLVAYLYLAYITVTTIRKRIKRK